LDALREILSTAPRVSFYGFLMALAKCDMINEDIGEENTKDYFWFEDIVLSISMWLTENFLKKKNQAIDLEKNKKSGI
jgi:hypothetical protein